LILKSIKISRKTNIIKEKLNIQEGEVVYSDLDVPAKSLYSKRYSIVGKPDYIIRKNKQIIPVEIKTSTVTEPQRNHIFQLLAYCQLVEDCYRVFTQYGLLVYNNGCHYKINFTPKLRFKLEMAIKKMRRLLRNKELIRNHNDPSKCICCSMREYCKLKLV